MDPENLVLVLDEAEGLPCGNGREGGSRFQCTIQTEEGLHPRELYALVHVIFSDTNIQVYLHKKYYLRIG